MLNRKTPRYKSSIEECDVHDRNALIRYRAKRDLWLGWYEHNTTEPHSIQQQLFSMIFIDLTYRTVTSSRGRAEGGANMAAKSGILAHLLDQGYVANQVLAIRRLLDPRHDVISLRRLLNDLSKNRNLLSREIYVCYDGLPYDPDSWQRLPPTQETNMWGLEAPSLDKYLGSRSRHEMFDRLAGVSLLARARTDRIRDAVFDRLEEWVRASPADKFLKLSHKFFAHAAEPSSRGTLAYSGIKLADVALIQRALVRVERAITDQVLFIAEGRDVVPMPPLGLFKGLDSPYASTDSVEMMYRQWDELSKERDNWTQGLVEELTA
jgi:hypothetical protein